MLESTFKAVQMDIASIHLLNQHEHQVRSICTCTQSLPTFIANERHSNVKRWLKVTRGNHRNVMKVLLILIVYLFYHRICGFWFFCQKSCQLLSYKSDTCTRFFQCSSYNRQKPTRTICSSFAPFVRGHVGTQNSSIL